MWYLLHSKLRVMAESFQWTVTHHCGQYNEANAFNHELALFIKYHKTEMR
jgi:hypothetical protein